MTGYSLALGLGALTELQDFVLTTNPPLSSRERGNPIGSTKLSEGFVARIEIPHFVRYDKILASLGIGKLVAENTRPLKQMRIPRDLRSLVMTSVKHRWIWLHS